MSGLSGRRLSGGLVEDGEAVPKFFQHFQWVTCEDIMSSAKSDRVVFWSKGVQPIGQH